MVCTPLARTTSSFFFSLCDHQGDLKSFLQSTKKERSKLSVRQVMDIAKQISIGMEHLSNSRLIHKDLAARNCIITSDLKVKVSSVALIKDVHYNDYSQFRNQVRSL
jgi:PTK7 protein tyrosine kinase 7